MSDKPLKMFDLFAGIGGFRLALERLGWKCVGWCEIDKFCQQTYRANFNTEGGFFWDDAKTLPIEQVPDFDVLCAGFPCQSFSLAGRRKGFEDTRGTLFFEIARLLEAKRPKAFLLENVKGLVCRPFKDREFKRMLEILRELGYQVFWRVLNSKDYGVPQNRERVFIVGFKEHRFTDFVWPPPIRLEKRLADVLEEEVPEKYYLSEKMVRTLLKHLERSRERGVGFGVKLIDGAENSAPAVVSTYLKGPGGAGRPALLVQASSGRPDNRLIEIPTGEHRAYRVYDPCGISPTITSPSGGNLQPKIIERTKEPNETACLEQWGITVQPFPICFLNRNQQNFGSDVSMTVDTSDSTGVLISSSLLYRIRRLTPVECERLQGFPDNWTKWGLSEGKVVEISDTQRYKMIGNAVTVSVVEAIGKKMEEWLKLF